MVSELKNNIINALNRSGIDNIDPLEWLRALIYHKKGKEIELKGNFDHGLLIDCRQILFNELEINNIQDNRNNVLKYY